MLKKIIFLFLIIIPLLQTKAFSQTEQQVADKLKSQGITSQQDVLNALQQRGMTEDDARKLAKQYGMNYDEFISSYIMGGKTMTSATMPIVNTVPTNIVIIPPTDTIKQIVQQQVSEKVDSTIKKIKESSPYFGYSIFSNVPQAFQPNQVGAIDPGYLVGPGDVLQLYVWGEVQFQHQLPVDQQGNVFIPTVGQFFVSGVAYKDLQDVLTNYLSKYYSGLGSSPPTTFLSITMAQLRPIRIFVMGEVAQPGGYTISSFATVFNALYSVGGPLTSGSLRNIRVLRNSKVIANVDLYDYLLNGKIIGDVRLQDNDLIFIPPRGRTITIKGEVLRPSIYELKDGENLSKLISYAGGLNTAAYTGRAQVNRIIPFAERKNFELERKIIDVNLDSVLFQTNNDFKLFDKDEVTIFPVLNKLENYVTIDGAVYRPGTYALEKVSNISELIKESYGLLPEAYLGKADITRTRPDETKEFLTFDLGRALNGDPNANLKLKPRDEVKIYSIYDLKDLQNVSISGYVKRPVTLTYADSLTLYDMVFKAGGLEDPFFRAKAYLQRGDLIRFNSDGLTTTIIPFDLGKLLNDKKYNMTLQPGDRVYIYKADVDKVIDKTVKIEGDVRDPGEYKLDDNMTPMDLILRANGFNETSLKSEVYVSRLDINGYPGEQISQTYIVRLPEGFEPTGKGEKQEFIDSTGGVFYLQNNDIVVVRRNPKYEPQRTVKITGEVKLPGTYVLKNKNEKLIDLIKEAGGPTSESFFGGAYFNRDGDRVAMDLDKIYNDEDRRDDIFLHQGDEIFIPKKPHQIIIKGEVGQPGIYNFIKGMGIKDYIANAGGDTDSSNYIIYKQATGMTERIGFGLFSGNPEVTDGSIITVTKMPYEPPVANTGESIGTTIKDILAIVVSAVTAIVLAKSL